MNSISRVPIFVAALHFLVASALADGCFVFRWDKKVDINEPTQKAIILHHAGREDLLLQVKFEGAVEDFGWLIPTPSLPKVEAGSMEAFYELSQLTQGGGVVVTEAATKGSDAAGPPQRVKVIETKTVGAYEISILSAADAGSLEKWLRENSYVIPGGKEQAAVLDDYIRRGWFFVAVKIDLSGRTGLKIVTKSSTTATPKKAAVSVRKKLASGELHPMLISFDTERCIFPLKISAVSGKPSEVSLYVLSKEPLLNRFLFEEAYHDFEKHALSRGGPPRGWGAENVQMMNLSLLLNDDVRNDKSRMPRNWSVEDLRAMVRESARAEPDSSIDEVVYWSGRQLLHCMRVEHKQLSKSSRSIPRLRNGSWFVTKVARTFAAAEMQDLEFVPAAPVVAEALQKPTGSAAAQLLATFGDRGVDPLLEACGSANVVARKNSAIAFRWVKNPRVAEGVIKLLGDEGPEVRLHAILAAENNWDQRYLEPVVRLFRDENPQIRGEASGCVASHEAWGQALRYLEMVRNADGGARICALNVLMRLDRSAIPQDVLTQMLGDRDPDVQGSALHCLMQMRNRNVVSREELLPLLSSERFENIMFALTLIRHENGPQRPPVTLPGRRESQNDRLALTSAEAAPLATNRFAMARLNAVRILRRNADEQAIQMMLRLLRDPNVVVRDRAFAAMKAMTGENVSDSDAAKWEAWWKQRIAVRQANTVSYPVVRPSGSER